MLPWPKLGRIEGRDYVFDPRYGEGVSQACAVLAAELIATRRICY